MGTEPRDKTLACEGIADGGDALACSFKEMNAGGRTLLSERQ
ncbi:MAG: hypothetical protein ABI395_09395 [Sphingobium sp.]